MRTPSTTYCRWMAGTLLVLCFAARLSNANTQPNVILIMTDDQGYGDLSCHGHPILKTPEMDALYADSVRLTDFHVDPSCSPTRSSLMTGRYSSRTGVWHTLAGRSIMRRDELTMAQVFAAGGCRTGLFGKWHLGDAWPYRPQDRGFGEVFYHGGGGVGQNPDYWGNDYFDDHYCRNGVWEKVEGYCTDVWFQEALKFIESNRNRPFFCYLATNAPHFWFRVPDQFAEPYFKLGMDEKGARFYGMIACIDYRLGQFRQRLVDWGLDENTILIFMTDNGNGGPRSSRFGRFGYDGGMREFKGSHYDGGHRVPCFIRWPGGGLTGGREVNELAAHVDLLPTLADLSGLPLQPKQPIDGISLASQLRGKKSGNVDRTLFVHQQRLEEPVKGRNWAAMTRRWRLVDGGELYDIKNDPKQQTNLAAQHPQVMTRLNQEYDAWWDSISSRFDEFCEVVIGAKEENPVKLTCHDWHSHLTLMTWNPAVIDAGEQANGFWAVDVARSGRYEFRLQMLPDEAAEQRAFGGVRVRLLIGDIEQRKVISPKTTSVTLNATLPAGRTRMQTWLVNQDDTRKGVPFVYIKYAGP